MTPEEITALAREYAEENVKQPEDMSNSLHNEYLKLFADEAEELIRFLLRRFCIVEKSVVEFEYNEVKEYLEKDRYLDMYDEYEAKRGLLEYLFPDLGKEVEL